VRLQRLLPQRSIAVMPVSHAGSGDYTTRTGNLRSRHLTKPTETLLILHL